MGFFRKLGRKLGLIKTKRTSMSKTKVHRKGKACTKAKGRLKKGCRWLRGHSKTCTCSKKGAKKRSKKRR